MARHRNGHHYICGKCRRPRGSCCDVHAEIALVFSLLRSTPSGIQRAFRNRYIMRRYRRGPCRHGAAAMIDHATKRCQGSDDNAAANYYGAIAQPWSASGSVHAGRRVRWRAHGFLLFDADGTPLGIAATTDALLDAAAEHHTGQTSNGKLELRAPRLRFRCRPRRLASSKGGGPMPPARQVAWVGRSVLAVSDGAQLSLCTSPSCGDRTRRRAAEAGSGWRH